MFAYPDYAPPRRSLLAPESLLLAAICLLDLLTTCFWIRYREAAEGNPLMAWYLASGGTPVFVLVKFVLCALPLFVAEWARQTRPRFVQAALRLTIAAYVMSYGAGVTHLNKEQKVDAELVRVTALAARPFPPDLARSLRAKREVRNAPVPAARGRQGWLGGGAAAGAPATTTTLPPAE